VELRYAAMDNGVATYGLCNYGGSSSKDGEVRCHRIYLFEERLDYCILLLDLGQEVLSFTRRRNGQRLVVRRGR